MSNGTQSLPSLAVIIPTKNRHSDLERTLASVARQSVPARQVVIVDQSEHPEFCESLQRLVGDVTRLDYIHDAGISGGAAARNRALAMAESDVFLFLDDDVVLEPDFFERILEVYCERPETAGVSGVITNYAAPRGLDRLWRALFARGPFRDERQAVYWNAEHLRDGEPIPVRRFGAGLMSFRAAAIGGVRFDENLSGVSDGEDVDFCLRLPAGSLLLMNPRARLEHRQSPSGRLGDHWLRRTARGNNFLYWRHWNRGLANRVWFVWLTSGYVVVALFGCLRRWSLGPWRALRRGMQEGKDATLRRRSERDVEP